MALTISEYEERIAPTDRLTAENLSPVLLGLFGEVGSIMATSKKLHREGEAFIAYLDAVEEEFGDALWYLCALCRRVEEPLDQIISDACNGEDTISLTVASLHLAAPVAKVQKFQNLEVIDVLLKELGIKAADLLNAEVGQVGLREQIVDFTAAYLKAVQASNVPFGKVVRSNLDKATGRFIAADQSTLPRFDEKFSDDESLPDKFEIEIQERPNGKSYLRWKGVFIGDPLTDNIGDPDGYRFHDVFHFSHAAILHWSPTFRALIKHKRKSRPDVDEAQDSGRAIVIEEGLSAYIFSCAKELNFFEEQSTISFDILKTVSHFVRGYEVEQCPLYLWEKAILQGYEVFRKIKKNNGGLVVCDKVKREISYRALL
ncbi:nucleoside triphosphate pyrophosphohydrolase family protein [Roseovarius aestuarii]|nr:nucleoside triphosphate pyrophosphohydrolase family protein [Roseovarius aestuarii]